MVLENLLLVLCCQIRWSFFQNTCSQLCFSFFFKLRYQSCISWQRIRLTCPGFAPPGWSRRCRNGKGLRPQNCQSTSCCALRPHRLDPECSTELYGSHHIHKLVVCCTGKATPCKLVFYCRWRSQFTCIDIGLQDWIHTAVYTILCYPAKVTSHTWIIQCCTTL